MPSASIRAAPGKRTGGIRVTGRNRARQTASHGTSIAGRPTRPTGPGSGQENMTDQTAEEIPGQQTLDECGPSGSRGDGGTPDGGPGDDLDPTVGSATTSTAESSAPGAAEPDPSIPATAADTSRDASTPDSPATITAPVSADVSDVHRFRIVHETSNEGATEPHSVTTSAPLELESAMEFLAAHAHDLPKVIALLTSFL